MSNNINAKIKKQIVESLDLSKFTAGQQNKIISGLINNVALTIYVAILDGLQPTIEEATEKVIREFGQLRNK